jgi:hypothetical protein
MRGLLHQDTAIYASFVSCSNLLFIFLRNTVCVGHGPGDLYKYEHFEVARTRTQSCGITAQRQVLINAVTGKVKIGQEPLLRLSDLSGPS